MKVFPLQLPFVDWENYIKICQEELDTSPTRGIDAIGIKTASPSALVHTLDLDNHPRLAIKSKELYAHTFFSFICVLDFDDEDAISHFLRIPVIARAGLKHEVAIYSATLKQWDYLIVSFSKRETWKPIREFLNIVMNHLRRAGFNEVWSEYEELQLNDGTFMLQYK